MPNVLVDTGIWLALCDGRDDVVPREVIDGIYDRIRLHSIIVPWPIAYETLRTAFVRKPRALERFERELKGPNISFVDDTPHRDDAYSLSVHSSLRGKRPLSMVDCLIRILLESDNYRIHAIVTFNPKDFFDVCKNRRIELWTQ